MGYRTQRNIYKLVWPEGHPLHDLHIWAKSCPIGTMLELNKLASKLVGGKPDMDAALRMFDIFADALVRWDLEAECVDPGCSDEGEHWHAVPVGRDGLDELEMGDLVTVITTWAQAVTQVSRPLEKPSIPSGIPPIPMTPSMDGP